MYIINANARTCKGYNYNFFLLKGLCTNVKIIVY